MGFLQSVLDNTSFMFCLISHQCNTGFKSWLNFSQGNLPVNMMAVSYPQSHSYPPQDDFHKAVARTLSQGSAPMSMDFHPVQQTLLLGKFFNASLS